MSRNLGELELTFYMECFWESWDNNLKYFYLINWNISKYHKVAFSLVPRYNLVTSRFGMCWNKVVYLNIWNSMCTDQFIETNGRLSRSIIKYCGEKNVCMTKRNSTLLSLFHVSQANNFICRKMQKENLAKEMTNFWP